MKSTVELVARTETAYPELRISFEVSGRRAEIRMNPDDILMLAETLTLYANTSRRSTGSNPKPRAAANDGGE
jgi:hypothetical protein